MGYVREDIFFKQSSRKPQPAVFDSWMQERGVRKVGHRLTLSSQDPRPAGIETWM